MEKQEELFLVGQALAKKLEVLAGFVGSNIEFTDEENTIYRNDYNNFYMELIDWDETVSKYIRWRIQEEKRNEQNNLRD